MLQSWSVAWINNARSRIVALARTFVLQQAAGAFNFVAWVLREAGRNGQDVVTNTLDTDIDTLEHLQWE